MANKMNHSRTSTYSGGSSKTDVSRPKTSSGAHVLPVESPPRAAPSREPDRLDNEPVASAGSSLKSDISELKESVKQRVSDEATTVVEAVKDVAAKGSEVAHEAGDKIVEVSHDVTEKVAEVTSEVTEKVAAISHDVTEKVAEVSHEVTEKVGQVAHDAQVALTRVGRSIVRGVKENPVPIALTGAGLAWLTVNLLRGPAASGGASTSPAPSGEGKQGKTSRRRPGTPGKTNGAASESPEEESTGEKLKEGAAEAVASVQHTAEGVVAGASELATRAGASVSKATRAAGVSAKKLFGNVAMQTIRAERAVVASMQENPMAYGVAALATGAVIGSLLPRTRLENAWLGEQRDEVVEKAQELVRGAVDKVESVASTVSEAAGAVAKSANH